MAELWRDRWCFACHGLRRFGRDEKSAWRCGCGILAVPIVARHLDEDEAAARRPEQPEPSARSLFPET